MRERHKIFKVNMENAFCPFRDFDPKIILGRLSHYFEIEIM